MNFKKSLKYIALMSLLLIYGFNLKIKADSNNTTDAIQMIGAQIRTDDINGLRFVSEFDFDNLEINKNQITKYGTVIAFGDANPNNLFLNATVNGKNVASAESEWMSFDSENRNTLVLINFSTSLYTQKFSARAYVKYMDNDNELVLYSSNVITRSVYEVAKNVSSSEYTTNIINSVETNQSGVQSIESAKSSYNNSDITVAVKGIVTAVSTGSNKLATIEDESGAITVFNYGTSYNDSFVIGNELLIEATLTKFNGLYELKTITSCSVLNKANDINDLYVDANLVFDSSASLQSHIVKGFLKYNSTSSNNYNFKTINDNSALIYKDAKWSTFSSATLTSDDWYYVEGIASYYNKNQIIPVNANPFKSITSVEVINESEYLINDFNISSFDIKITLNDNSIIIKKANLDMLSDDDLIAIQSTGNKNITISYLGRNISVSFSLIDKEISSIELISFNDEYYIGDEIDLSNAYFKINYVDGTETTKNITLELISGFDSTSIGNKTFSLTYSGISIDVDYSVDKKIVIYEMYGGGGNTNASYKNDYVILYNNSNEDINLSDYKLCYGKSTNTTFASYVTLEDKLYSKSYYVIKLKAGSSGYGEALEYANITFDTIDMSGSTGRVALIYGTYNTNIDSNTIIDVVLYSGLANNKSYRIDLNDYTYDVITSPTFDFIDTNTTIKNVSYSGLKTTYKLNDSLDLTNVTFNMIRANGKKENFTLTNSAVSGFSTLQLGTFEMTFMVEDYTFKVIYSVTESGESELDVRIYYIDLGDDLSCCGESTYIQIGSGEDAIDILVDAGEKTNTCGNAIRKVINEHCEDNKLEYVISTHMHSDHIGGMQYVLPYYNIDNVIEFYYKYGKTASNSSSDFVCKYLYYRSLATNVYTAYELIQNNGGSIYTINLATNVSITLYNTGSLDSTDTSDKNKQSVVFSLNAFDTKVLFNGDAEKAEEAIYGPLVGDVDIFKLGHHGTYNATTSSFLSNISPEVAIVCNGNYLGNEYGHPTIEALSRCYSYKSNMKVYAITGANITGVEETTGSTPGSTEGILYYKNLASGYVRNWFKCTSTANAMLDRNGDITVTIDVDGYNIVSEFFNSNLREMKDTEYYKQILNILN